MQAIMLLLVLLSSPLALSHAANPDSLHFPRLVKAVLDRRQHSMWWGFGQQSDSLRLTLWHWIDSSRHLGLDSSRYHYTTIRPVVLGSGTAHDTTLEPVLTDAAVTIAKDLHDGIYVYGWLHYDELTERSAPPGDVELITAIAAIRTAADLDSFLKSREPRTVAYGAYRDALGGLPDTADPLRAKMLSVSIDYQRWIDHFDLHTFILVNIASATLRLYKGDSIRLQMKIVAGRPSTPTPRFSARCTAVVLYPYWYVPQPIAIKEFLPLFKATPSLADAIGMEILDTKGKAVDPETLPWSTFTKTHFPYRMRQLTGCGNALGVIKFELTDPFEVYMHDTNLKSAFASANRYYSHGCIRLEKPFLLARQLLGEKLDTMFLTECRHNEQPKEIPLGRSVPVLVVYMPVEADAAGNLTWFKDNYHLLSRK